MRFLIYYNAQQKSLYLFSQKGRTKQQKERIEGKTRIKDQKERIEGKNRKKEQKDIIEEKNRKKEQKDIIEEKNRKKELSESKNRKYKCKYVFIEVEIWCVRERGKEREKRLGWKIFISLNSLLPMEWGNVRSNPPPPSLCCGFLPFI